MRPHPSPALTVKASHRLHGGFTMAFVMLGFTGFLLFAGLAIDVGYWYSMKARLQGTVDMAAMSGLGTRESALTTTDQENAIAKTVDDIALANGYEAGQFVCTFGGTATLVTTLTVTADQPCLTWFANVMGLQQVTLRARATAEDLNPSRVLRRCSSLSNNRTTIGAGGSTYTRFDAYDSGVATYSPVNSACGSPWLYDQAGTVLCAHRDTAAARIGMSFDARTSIFGSIIAFDKVRFRNAGTVTISKDLITRDTITGVGSRVICGLTQENAKLGAFKSSCDAAPANIATAAGYDNDTGLTCGGCTATELRNLQNRGPMLGVATVTGTNCTTGKKVVRLTKPGGQYYVRDWRLGVYTELQLDVVPNVSNPIKIFVERIPGGVGRLRALGGIYFNPARGGTPRAGAFKIIGYGTGAGQITIGPRPNLASCPRAYPDRVYAVVCAPIFNLTFSAGLHLLGSFNGGNVQFPDSMFTWDSSLGYNADSADGVMRTTHLKE